MSSKTFLLIPIHTEQQYDTIKKYVETIGKDQFKNVEWQRIDSFFYSGTEFRPLQTYEALAMTPDGKIWAASLEAATEPCAMLSTHNKFSEDLLKL